MLKKQNVQECIDTVNVALGFVQYSNWKSNTLLKRYMGILKMDGRLPKTVNHALLTILIFFKIEDRCELSQIISLWRILGVEQAKQIIKGNEVRSYRLIYIVYHIITGSISFYQRCLQGTTD